MVEIKIKKPREIKLRIAEKGYGVRGFAREVGISHSYLSQILNGHKKPSAAVALKIAKGLDKDISSLFLIKVVDELPVKEA